MSEVLAAGLLRLSDWDQKSNLIDPMCGSGTIAIEAAMLANGIYPGSVRKNFAFKNWSSFNPELFKRMENEVQPAEQTAVRIFSIRYFTLVTLISRLKMLTQRVLVR